MKAAEVKKLRDDEIASETARLRKKLGAHASMLATVWGIGYRLEATRGKAG